ncbi:MAG: hypothetical protein WBC40_11375 [Halobacteriota archaeon]
MFSNKYKIGKMVLVFLLLLFLCHYGYHKGPETGGPELQDYLDNAELFDGAELVSLYSKVGEVNEGRFELIYRYGDERRKIIVIGNAEGLEEGDIVSVKSIFRKDGFLELEEIHIHKHLYLQWYASLLPIPFVILFFFKEFKFKLQRLEFERRR